MTRRLGDKNSIRSPNSNIVNEKIVRYVFKIVTKNNAELIVLYSTKL